MRAPKLKRPHEVGSSSYRKSALARVRLFGAKASSPLAEKRLLSLLKPIMPSTLPIFWWRASTRRSLLMLVKVVPTSLPSNSVWR